MALLKSQMPGTESRFILNSINVHILGYPEDDVVLELENRELGTSFSSPGSQMEVAWGRQALPLIHHLTRWALWPSAQSCHRKKTWADSAFELPAPQKLLKFGSVPLSFVTGGQ